MPKHEGAETPLVFFFFKEDSMHAVLDILFSIPAFVVLACVASLAFERKGDRRNMIEGTMESIEKLRESSRLKQENKEQARRIRQLEKLLRQAGIEVDG